MAIVLNPISPVAFSVFGLPIRWYALAYVTAFVVGYILLGYFLRKDKENGVSLNHKQMEDLFTYLILGVIIGGRLGYALFYNPIFFLENPWEIVMLWHGGMSFHGGLLGVIIATFLYTKSWTRGLKILDVLAVIAPIGLFFGRIANFINMEIMGRPTDSPLGVVFNGYNDVPRHASPLYEAVTEGILLFVIMLLLYKRTNLRRYPGALGGTMLMLYAIFRIFCEQFRAPDIQIGFLTSWGLTMGQLLSAIMFVVGGTVLFLSMRKK